jgi:hypothetical protein
VLGLVLLPLSAEPASKGNKHSLDGPPAPLPASVIREVFLPKCPAHVVTPRPVAERSPRVDRYWPERRMCLLPDLRDSHRWVAEQEKEAWRFVDSIGK